MAREFAAAFYKTKAWHDCRAAYISKVGGLCEDCLAKGLYTPGKVVHHIKPLTPSNINDPAITTGFDNLRLVCQDCHAKEHSTVPTDRYRVDEYGNITEV